jgi:hypothetical protein
MAMRAVTLALLVALTGCVEAPPRSTYSPPSPAIAWPVERQACLKRQIERRVADVWAAPAAEGEFPASVISPAEDHASTLSGLDEIPAAALEKCIPSYRLGTKYTSVSRVQAFADSTYYAAKQKYVSQIGEILRDREVKKTADDQARLTQGEPAVMNDYHECLFQGVDWMALVFDEPAQDIVSTTYTACRPQRTAIVELHKRYGDAAFNDQIMDRVETGVAATLILEVIRVREAAPAQAVPEPPLSLPAPL